MGKIIKLDNAAKSPPDVLTSTGPGGLFSTRYLQYADASQPDAALAEYKTAQAAFETALIDARGYYLDATDHLEAELNTVEQRLSRAKARPGGEPVDVDDRFDETGTTPGPDITTADKRSLSPTDTTERSDIEDDGTDPKIDPMRHGGS